MRVFKRIDTCNYVYVLTTLTLENRKMCTPSSRFICIALFALIVTVNIPACHSAQEAAKRNTVRVKLDVIRASRKEKMFEMC